MSEIVERGQSALKAYWLEHGYDPSDPDDGLVRAVIAAMREPTESMLDNGYSAMWSKTVWQAMIDEALR